MQLYRKLEDFVPPQEPLALTVGTFDGVHRGHRMLFDQLKQRGFPIVLTFENHPAEIVRPQAVPLKLCTTEHKLKLLDEAGIKTVVLLTFTKEISTLSPEGFLDHVRRYVPFDLLLLGLDATLGKDRQGDPQHLQQLAQRLRFKLEYVQEYLCEGFKVSSSAIRSAIQAGDLQQAKKLLGRSFSIYGPIHTGAGMGKKLGFPTMNLNVTGLCLPPLGVYAVTLNGHPGVANLGVAPTVKEATEPLLEVHLFDAKVPDASLVEVTFEKYLRPERKFDNLDQLKVQIALDVAAAKQLLSSPPF